MSDEPRPRKTLSLKPGVVVTRPLGPEPLAPLRPVRLGLAIEYRAMTPSCGARSRTARAPGAEESSHTRAASPRPPSSPLVAPLLVSDGVLDAAPAASDVLGI